MNILHSYTFAHNLEFKYILRSSLWQWANCCHYLIQNDVAKNICKYTLLGLIRSGPELCNWKHSHVLTFSLCTQYEEHISLDFGQMKRQVCLESWWWQACIDPCITTSHDLIGNLIHNYVSIMIIDDVHDLKTSFQPHPSQPWHFTI